MSEQPEPVQATPKMPKWQVNIQLYGNLLISQEKAFRGWVASRGGITKRTAESHENILWHSQFVSPGANNLQVTEWVTTTIRRLCPGDRLDSVRISVGLVAR